MEKLACFGLFANFHLSTIKNSKESILDVKTKFDENNDDYQYSAQIGNSRATINKPTGTTITLSGTEKTIPKDDILAQQIAKRLNIMYDSSSTDTRGFVIKIGNIKVNKQYRDNIVLKQDINFSLNIPENLTGLTSDANIINYFTNNNITGTIIAKNKTVNIKENRGVVLFARNKLCQEATYLSINPANSYGYAHLYAELYVDFIDNEKKDNIGTDRTALKDTPTTKDLFEMIEELIKRYGDYYDKDRKEKTEQMIDNYQEENKDFREINNSLDSISNDTIRNTLNELLRSNIKVRLDDENSQNVTISNLSEIQMLINNTIASKVIQPSEFDYLDTKDNISRAIDKLDQYLRKKYSYNGADGESLINTIFRVDKDNSQTNEKFQLNELFTNATPSTQQNIKKLPRNLGRAIVNARNIFYIIATETA